MPNDKLAGSRTEMKCLNAPQDDDSCSSNSNDLVYSDFPKKIPLNGQYPDADAESQNFLSDHNPSKKKYETEYHQGSASFGMSVFNLGNAIMGSGILGLSFAMANTGIALFVILLVSVAIFSLYSVHLLLKTANEAGALVYESLGYKAFGIPGKLAASCSITMQNIGAMSSYLFIIKYELPIVIQSFTGANDGSKMPNDKLAGSRTEMKCLNAPQDDDSCSSNSNDLVYSDFPKKIPLNGSRMLDAGPEDNSSSSICSKVFYLEDILDGIPGFSCQHQESLCSASVSSDEQSDAEDDDADSICSCSSDKSMGRPFDFQTEDLPDGQDSDLDAESQNALHDQNSNEEKESEQDDSFGGRNHFTENKNTNDAPDIDFPKKVFFFQSVIFLIFGVAVMFVSLSDVIYDWIRNRVSDKGHQSSSCWRGTKAQGFFTAPKL